MKYCKPMLYMIVMLMLVISGNQVKAQTNSTNANLVYLPIARAEVDKATKANDLVQRLNERYAGTGISFFVFESVDSDTLQAASNSPAQGITIESSKVVNVASEEELMKLVDSMYTATASQEETETLNIDKGQSDEVVYAANITRFAVATWYQAACGGGAYFLGGVFCWKNIDYNYTTDNTGYLLGGEVLTSYLTGINILSWTHRGGSAYRSGTGTITLNARGTYLMGVQAFGLTVGATWNDTWVRTVRPPCNCR